MSNSVQTLLNNAHDEGILGAASMQALAIVDVGQQIQAGMGVSIDDVQSAETVLLAQMPDDSGSILFKGNAPIVRQGHNLVIDALRASKQSDTILALCQYLNGEILYPFSPLDQAILMDERNYNPKLGTPLYDNAITLLGTVLAKTQEFADNGQVARSVILIITDGSDQHSRKATAADVKALIDDMLASEMHIVAGMGIDDGDTDFEQVFKEMGIRDEWILTPGSNESEIRAAFQTFSQSAVRASQGGANFSQARLGGFGA